MNIVIAGGGAAGSLAALILARAGHQILLLEQYPSEPAADIESAAAIAFRPTAPQVVQPHAVMARFRELLRERLPDVYRRLLAAGVVEVPISELMPATLADTAARSGDERLTLLMTRRSTLDWVLERAVLAEPGVTVCRGVRMAGLEAIPGKPPRVTGVRTDQGGFSADLVVDATGRRSRIDSWLEEIGAQPASNRWAECGVAYYGRHYRVRPAVELPGSPTPRIVIPFDEFTAGIWGADNGTMQMAVVPLARDHRFKTLRHPEVFTAVLRAIPVYAAWLDVLDPITDVFPMGAIHNTLRRLVVAGAPVVTGLAAIGDSVCATNPTLGRGLTFALSGAADLCDTLDKHPDDRLAQAIALDELVADHILPFYEDQAAIDYARLAMLDHKIFDAPLRAPPPAASGGRVTYAQLRIAAQFDATAFRAFWRIMGMTHRPDEVYTDPHVVACTKAALDRHGSESVTVQPTREKLLAALAR